MTCGWLIPPDFFLGFITAGAFLTMGHKLAVERRKSQGGLALDQTSVNREIVDWRSSIWDRFRGQFMVQGHMVRD